MLPLFARLLACACCLPWFSSCEDRHTLLIGNGVASSVPRSSHSLIHEMKLAALASAFCGTRRRCGLAIRAAVSQSRISLMSSRRTRSCSSCFCCGVERHLPQHHLSVRCVEVGVHILLLNLARPHMLGGKGAARDKGGGRANLCHLHRQGVAAQSCARGDEPRLVVWWRLVDTDHARHHHRFRLGERGNVYPQRAMQ